MGSGSGRSPFIAMGVTLLLVSLYEAKMIHHYDTHWATYEPDGETRYMTEG